MYSFSLPLWFRSPRMRSYSDFSNLGDISTAVQVAPGAATKLTHMAERVYIIAYLSKFLWRIR